MSLRALKRNIARERMKKAGVERINKRWIWKDNVHRMRDGSWTGGFVSYFAANWRKYLDPTTAEYKLAMSGQTRKKKGFVREIRKVRV